MASSAEIVASFAVSGMLLHDKYPGKDRVGQARRLPYSTAVIILTAVFVIVPTRLSALPEVLLMDVGGERGEAEMWDMYTESIRR